MEFNKTRYDSLFDFNACGDLLVCYPHPIFCIFLNKYDFVFPCCQIIPDDYLMPVSVERLSSFGND